MSVRRAAELAPYRGGGAPAPPPSDLDLNASGDRRATRGRRRRTRLPRTRGFPVNATSGTPRNVLTAIRCRLWGGPTADRPGGDRARAAGRQRPAGGCWPSATERRTLPENFPPAGRAAPQIRSAAAVGVQHAATVNAAVSASTYVVPALSSRADVLLVWTGGAWFEPAYASLRRPQGRFSTPVPVGDEAVRDQAPRSATTHGRPRAGGVRPQSLAVFVAARTSARRGRAHSLRRATASRVRPPWPRSAASWSSAAARSLEAATP